MPASHDSLKQIKEISIGSWEETRRIPLLKKKLTEQQLSLNLPNKFPQMVVNCLAGQHVYGESDALGRDAGSKTTC